MPTMTTKPCQNKLRAYNERYSNFLFKLIDVARCKPKDRFLYALMDSVPFKDLEVALKMMTAGPLAANDNNSLNDQ